MFALPNSPIAFQASFVLSNFLFHQCLRCSSIFPSHRFSHAIELGAGCGLSGIAFASAHATASVTLTDAHPLVIRRLHENAALNFVGDWEGKKGSIEVARLDWTDWRAEELPEADLILAAGLFSSIEQKNHKMGLYSEKFKTNERNRRAFS